MSMRRTSRVFRAITTVESAGLSVYRRRKKERGFMKVYTEPLNELLPKITPSAFKVFAALANQVGYDDTMVELSKTELMRITGLAEKTVRESLNELEELGVMKRIGPPNRRKYVMSQMYIKRGK